MTDDHEHVLRAWTVANEYQRVLREWAATHCWRGDVPDGRVTEIGIKYEEQPCRHCAVSDAEINISVKWSSGFQGTTFDSAGTIQSLAEMLMKLVPIAQEHGH